MRISINYGGLSVWPWIAIFAAAMWVGLPSAEATVVFDNFDAGGGFHPQSNSGAASDINNGFTRFILRAAAEFPVTGNSFSLDSITLPISRSSSNVAGDYLRVRLTADNAGAPGATLEVLSQNQNIWPAFSNPFTTTTTLTSAIHPLLSAGNNYWIVTELTSAPATTSVSSIDYRWYHNTSGTTVGFRQQQTADGTLPADPWTGFSGQNNVALRVDGSVPEPSSLLALSGGLLVLALVRRPRANG